MNLWLIFWTLMLVVAGGSFAVITIVVTVRGDGELSLDPVVAIGLVKLAPWFAVQHRIPRLRFGERASALPDHVRR